MANVALLATVADSAASQAAGAVSPLMPSGVVLPFAGSTSPVGWIVCDGTAYSQADYPALFAVLGSSYNTQVNPTTGSAWAAPSAGQFRVPDMRGLFLRGEGTASGGDAVSVGGHQGGKTAKNGLGSTFTGTSATTPSGGTHVHRTYPLVGANSGTFYTWTAASTAAGGSYGFGYGDHQVQSTESGHTHALTATGTNGVTGDNETRPTNRGVKYIIKA